MITRIQTTEFDIRNRTDNDKQSVARGVPFEIGDEVLIIPYTIGTIIQRANEKYYLIETDALNIYEETTYQYNDNGGTIVRYPRFREDKVIICKFDELPYTELVVEDFRFASVQAMTSGIVKIKKEDKDNYHTVILYDEELTNVKRIDDGFKIMTYSPSIVSMYPKIRANRYVLSVPKYWLGSEVMVIKW